jgi:6-phosphogluconolactonase
VKLQVAEDPHGAAEQAAAEIADRLAAAIDARGSAAMAFSRVSEPYDLFHALETKAVRWQFVHLFEVDERVAPDGDPERNAVALEAFAARLNGAPTVHLMAVNPPQPEQYAATLHEVCYGVLDVVHLGLGPDGHTASWPPGLNVEDIVDVDVARCPEYQGRERMTLTVPCVNAARWIAFLATGPTKRDALVALQSEASPIPAHRVRRDDNTWIFTDRAALEPNSS